MGFRGTLWRPTPSVNAQLRSGKRKIEQSGQVLTEKQAREKSKQRAKSTVDQLLTKDEFDPTLGINDTTEADRRFGQPHYGH